MSWLFIERADVEAETPIQNINAYIWNLVWRLRQHRSVAKRSYLTSKVRSGGCFDGAAMKRYHTSKVRETQLRGRH